MPRADLQNTNLVEDYLRCLFAVGLGLSLPDPVGMNCPWRSVNEIWKYHSDRNPAHYRQLCEAICGKDIPTTYSHKKRVIDLNLASPVFLATVVELETNFVSPEDIKQELSEARYAMKAATETVAKEQKLLQDDHKALIQEQQELKALKNAERSALDKEWDTIGNRYNQMTKERAALSGITFILSYVMYNGLVDEQKALKDSWQKLEEEKKAQQEQTQRITKLQEEVTMSNTEHQLMEKEVEEKLAILRAEIEALQRTKSTMTQELQVSLYNQAWIHTA